MKRFFIALLALAGVRSGLSAEQKHDATVATLQSVPGISASALATAADFSLSDLLVVSSIMFVLMQAAYLAWKWRRDAKRELERINDRRDARTARRRIDYGDTEPGDGYS